jgi:hypothetical protein
MKSAQLFTGAMGCCLILICGCAVKPAAYEANALAGEDSSYDLSARTERAPDVTASLFKDDQAVMSADEVATALNAAISVRPGAKLAVVRFGSMPYWWGWSEDFVRLNEKIDSDFLGRLSQAKRLREVAYLPALVTPTSMTIPHLRQAAARFQADTLLVYRTSTRSYDRTKLFKPDETKAYCTVEAVLLDTRSGIIPFSTVVTENFSAVKTPDDLNFRETVAKANQQTIAKAWLRVADQVNEYLNKLPAQ